MMMMQVLTDVELDAVAGGASSASLRITSAYASGPNNSTVDVEDVDVFAQTVGGLAPSNTSFVSARFTATAD